jgi:siroheme synthase-like protein
MSELLPLFLNLTGRTVVLVGGGPVATAKLRQLLAAGARVRVIAPEITDEILELVARGFPASADGRDDPAAARLAEAPEARRRQPSDPGRVSIAQRPFVPADLDGAWLVVAAATPEVNRHVAEVAETLRLFVNAVDDPANATAFLSGVVRRDGVTLAISTRGAAPALTALLREGLEALLPRDLATWMWQARSARVAWRREGVPMDARKPRLLQALNELYQETAERAESAGKNPFGPRVPWLNGPEDSWL